MEKTFQRELTELENIFQFIDLGLSNHRISARNAFSIKFVTEELFTNMVKYGKSSTGSISMKIERTKDACVVTLVDDGSERFDVTRAPEIDINQQIEDRTPGGLGIYLIHKIVDSIDYHYENRRSTITFTKLIEEHDA